MSLANITESIGNITEAKWYKTMMPKLYGWGRSFSNYWCII